MAALACSRVGVQTCSNAEAGSFGSLAEKTAAVGLWLPSDPLLGLLYTSRQGFDVHRETEIALQD